MRLLIGLAIDMGDSPFAREFIVQSNDSASALLTLNVSVQAILLENLKSPQGNLLDVSIGPKGAVLMTSSTINHDLWQFLIDFSRKIESALR